MDSPLRTHAAALLAFGTGGTKSDMGPRLLSGLLKRKDGSGGWGNTQENVYGIMGIAKLLRTDLEKIPLSPARERGWGEGLHIQKRIA